jgi:phosphate transport system substrate-binding protein
MSRRALAAAAVAVAITALAAPARAPAARIDISGSSTMLPLVADLAYFYRHEVRRPPRFSLVGGDTAVGIADVTRGITDLGMAARSQLPTDPAGLVFSPLAGSGVCIVTNRSNKLPGITRAQIQALVAGTITQWSELPGAGTGDAMVPVAFVTGVAARGVFESVFVDLETPVLYRARTFATPTQVRDFISVTPGAWGYIDLFFATQLHRVPYEGVPCTRAAIGDGTYPARVQLSLVTKGAPRGAVAGFLRWVRTSRTARRVIATRYLPVGRTEG